jgi:hypothetical protein
VVAEVAIINAKTSANLFIAVLLLSLNFFAPLAAAALR